MAIAPRTTTYRKSRIYLDFLMIVKLGEFRVCGVMLLGDRAIKLHQDRSPLTLNNLLVFLFVGALVAFVDALA